ncbi:unnamed protein product, partial [Brenthis ino]
MILRSCDASRHVTRRDGAGAVTRQRPVTFQQHSEARRHAADILLYVPTVVPRPPPAHARDATLASCFSSVNLSRVRVSDEACAPGRRREPPRARRQYTRSILYNRDQHVSSVGARRARGGAPAQGPGSGQSAARVRAGGCLDTYTHTEEIERRQDEESPLIAGLIGGSNMFHRGSNEAS